MQRVGREVAQRLVVRGWLSVLGVLASALSFPACSGDDAPRYPGVTDAGAGGGAGRTSVGAGDASRDVSASVDARSGVLDSGADARPSPSTGRDAAVGGPFDASRGDVAGEAGGAACDLVAQDCPSGAFGCYRGPAGGTRCALPTGGGGPAGTTCTSDEDCLPGTLCGAAGGGIGQCQDICRTPDRPCPGNGRCAPVSGGAVGICPL